MCTINAAHKKNIVLVVNNLNDKLLKYYTYKNML